MNKWRNIRAVCAETWTEGLAKPQFFAALLFVFVFTAMRSFRFISLLAQDAGRLIVPEVVVLSLNDSLTYFFVMGGFFIFLMRAPFLARTDTVFLPRVQRGPWIWGKILFLGEYLLIATLANDLFMLFICAPFVDFQRWNTWTPFLVEQYYLGAEIGAVSPLYCLVCTYFLNFCLLFFLALLTLFLNLYYQRTASLLLVGGLCALTMLLNDLGPLYTRLSLISHAQFLCHQFQGLDNILGGPARFTPAIWESFVVFLTLTALLLLLILRRVRRCDFQMNGKGMN